MKNRMKSIVIGSLIFASSQVFSATTGDLILRGVVPELISISVNAQSVASSLPLDTTQSDTLVATVNEKSNSNNGYSVAITSANLGNLVHQSVTSSSIAYGLKYDGNVVDLANGDQFDFNSSASVDATKNIQISYTGVPHESLVEGAYSDTVTFTISAN
jgi:hypothetical protein